MSGKLAAALICLALMMPAITTCSGITPVPTVTPTPTPSPALIARRAGKVMLSTHSLHFIIELDGRPVYLDDPPTMALKHAEGDLVRPDQVRAIVKVSSMGLVSEVAIIGIGAKQYITNPLNQQWEKLPPDQGWYFDPALMFDPQVGIDAVLREADWSFAGEEEIDEQTHDHLHVRLPGEQITPLASGMIGSGEVEVDVWVGRGDAFVRRIQMLELESDSENPTLWLLEFSAFDELKKIKPPPLP